MSTLKKTKSFYQKCLDAGVRPDTAKYYRKAHPELTDEQVIEHYTSRKMTFRDRCRQLGIDTHRAEKYKYSHRELTDDQVIEELIRLDNIKNLKYVNKTFRDKCRYHNIDISKAEKYKYKHKELSDEQIIEHFITLKKKSDTHIPFSELCRINVVNYNKARWYKSRHPELTDEQIIESIKEIDKDTLKSFRQKCKDADVSYDGAKKYKNKHPELTDEQIIDLYKSKGNSSFNNPKDKDVESFRKKCIINEIDYKKALNCRRRHPELTDEQIIDLYKSKNNILRTVNIELKNKCIENNLDYRIAYKISKNHKKWSNDDIIRYMITNNIKSLQEIGHKRVLTGLGELCKKANIDLNTATKYRSRHPELSIEEIIIHYRPDCYINLFGELVIPYKEDKQK